MTVKTKRFDALMDWMDQTNEHSNFVSFVFSTKKDNLRHDSNSHDFVTVISHR